MTHTFKLARRLARYRTIATLAALFVASSCGGTDDLATTAPSAPPAGQPDMDSLSPTGPVTPEPPSSPPPPPTSPEGVPVGPFNAWDDAVPKTNTEIFTASFGSVNPTNILQRLEAARTKGVKLILAMTGGDHSNYLTKGVFDLAKWQAEINRLGTPEIEAAVAAGVADGTIIGNSVMDEPHVHGQGDGNTWGPPGTMTKARVDEMCAYVKSIFPTLPVGVVHGHDSFQPAQSYKTCEFLVVQYAWRKTAGNIEKFRDEALALGQRDGMAIVFSMNLLNGGVQAPGRDSWNCPLTTTGGRGTFRPNCRMTAAQVRQWGTVLGVAGCALMMWRYDPAFMSQAANQQAFKDVAATLARAPGRRCQRS